MSDVQLFFILIVLAIILLISVISMIRKDGSNLMNGIILNLFLFVSAIAIMVGGLAFDSFIMRILMLIVVAIMVLITVFGLIVIIFGSIMNGYVVLKREGLSIANLLTLLIGIGLIIFMIVKNISLLLEWSFFTRLLTLLQILIIYFALSFYNYLMSALAYGFLKPTYDKDFIIVLGAGLINGDQVSKLLASRINRALSFYHIQKETNPNVKLIFSGGQGANERIPEGQAMAEYAQAHGIDARDILIEDQSTNTLENFQYSYKLVQKVNDDAKLLFVTSNYHVFRAGLYTKMLGLNAVGLGSHTAWYYLPNAMLREYIAIIVLNWQSYLLKVILIIVLFISSVFLQA